MLLFCSERLHLVHIFSKQSNKGASIRQNADNHSMLYLNGTPFCRILSITRGCDRIGHLSWGPFIVTLTYDPKLMLLTMLSAAVETVQSSASFVSSLILSFYEICGTQ